MSGNSIIPGTIVPFGEFINLTNARQLAINPDTTNPYWTDYGWTAGQSDDYNTFAIDWGTLFALYINPLSSTSVVKENLSNKMKEFTHFVHDQKLIDKIFAWAEVTTDDSTTFNFVLNRDAEPTHLSAPIEGIPVADIKILGRGDMDVHVKEGEDSNRASIARGAGADAVQYQYMIVDNTTDVTDDPDDARFAKYISTKAHFKLTLGGSSQRKLLVIFFRWFNTRYPQYAGTWSTVTVVSIA